MCATASSRTRWRAALLTELEHAAREAPGRRVETIFFGGGTPSLMEPATVGAVIARTRQLWDSAPDSRSRSKPTRPRSKPAKFAALAEAGVNRVSLGVQALDPAVAALPRPRAFRRRGDRRDRDGARRHFARYSFDLIYARPGQTAEAWAAELERALALAGEHLSLYQLTIERGTRFFAEHARGAFTLPGEEEAARDVRAHPGAARGGRACRPTRSPTMPSRGLPAAII